MSRKPSVMSSAVFAPFRSSSVLMAIVEPCRNRYASADFTPAPSIVFWIPRTSSPCVESAFPNIRRPSASSKAARSVNVPPMSTAIRRRPLAFDPSGAGIYFSLHGFVVDQVLSFRRAAVSARGGGLGLHRVAQEADAVDLDFDDVAVLHPERRLTFPADPAGSPRGNDIARGKPREGADVRDDDGNGEDHMPEGR